MHSFKKTILGTTLFAAIAAAAPAAAALQCPGGAVKIVVANPPGGTTDLVARALADKAAPLIGQSFVLENRPGASTTIGANHVAKARPDGCTLLVMTAAGVVATVYRDNLPYDLKTDFAPVSGIGSFPMVLAVSAQSNLKTLEDVKAALRSGDGITYASGGAGTMGHLSTVRLIDELGGKGNHIPFKGNSEAMHALMANHVQMFFPSSAEAISLAGSGKIRLIGITSSERLPALPDVPTMAELGFSDFNPRLWYGFVAPAGTPAADIAQLKDAFLASAGDPSIKNRFVNLGFTFEVGDGAALAAHIQREAERWGRIIRDNNLKSAH